MFSVNFSNYQLLSQSSQFLGIRLIFIANSIGADTREIWRKLADTVFIHDLINYKIELSKTVLLFSCSCSFTRTMPLFFVLKHKTKLEAGTFFLRAQSLAYSAYNRIDFFSLSRVSF